MSIDSRYPVKPGGPRPNCAAPGLWAMVDEAFERPGGDAGVRMRTEICPGCPIGETCLAWAMAHREDGIWGGAGPNGRTRHGGPPSPNSAVEYAQRHGLPAPVREHKEPIVRVQPTVRAVQRCSVCGETGHRANNPRHRAAA